MTTADLSLQLNLIKMNLKTAQAAINALVAHVANVEAELAKLEKPEPILQLATKTAAIVPVTEAKTIIPEPPKVETRLCPTCKHDCFPMVTPIDAKTSWRTWFCGHCKTVTVDPRKLLRDGNYLPNTETRQEIQFSYAEWDKLREWEQVIEIGKRFSTTPYVKPEQPKVDDDDDFDPTQAVGYDGEKLAKGDVKLLKDAMQFAKEQSEQLVINDEWQRVLDLLNNGDGHVFITGDAGTGKSTLLQYFVQHCRKNVAIVAPTGVAALRAGGQTLHSFFRFGAHAMENDDISRISDDKWRQKYERLDILVIDEISMVRADVMDAVEKHLRVNGPKTGRPFGGVRLIVIGDLYQLPPVSKENNEKKYLISRYGTDTPYFFHAECWRDAAPKIVELTTIFRQKDPAFTAALNAIRRGTVTPEHLMLINSRVDPKFVPSLTGDLWLTLTTTNHAAEQANIKMLSSLPGSARYFDAKVVGDFNLKDAPTAEHLELKPGAVVMFIRNNPEGGWVNGTLGKVLEVEPLIVEVKGEEKEVEPETWEKIQYEWDESKKKLTKNIVGKFTQIPLKPAAAITIHKSQGLSLDHAIIDLSHGAFASGQAYVGISRLRSLDGMVLRRALKESDLITSQEVINFMTGKPIARPGGQLSLMDAVKEAS